MTPETEGVIKFNCVHEYNPAVTGIDPNYANELLYLRKKLYDLQVIGVDADGVGYGNVSRRINGGFLITGSQTGHLPELTPDDLSYVYDWDILKNELYSIGLRPPSSESLTHAAVYEYNYLSSVVIHGHHPKIWEDMRHRLPVTPPEASYGTPAMARAVGMAAEPYIEPAGIIMGGHMNGFIIFGEEIEKTCNYLYEILFESEKN